MTNLYSSTLPIISLILVGIFSKRYLIKNDAFWHKAEKLTYYILLPVLLIKEITTIENAHATFGDLIAIMILSTVIIALLLITIQRFIKFNGAAFSSLFQGVTRYNSYVLVSLLVILLLDEGIVYFGITTLFMIVLTNISSVVVLNVYCRDNKLEPLKLVSQIIKNPLIIAIILGLLGNYLAVTIPEVIDHNTKYIGYAAVFISLTSVGAGLRLTLSFLQFKLVAFTSFLKLLLLPAVTIALMPLFNLDDTEKLVAILYASLPCAGNAYILARQMHGDAELMASIVTATTLLSVITIPLLMSISLNWVI